MTNPRDQQAELDRYLDGVMDASERRAFEAAIGETPSLEEACRLQAAIDGALKQHFEPPSEAALENLLAGARAVPARRPRQAGFGRAFKIAASIVLCVTGLWLTMTALRGRNTSFIPYSAPTPRTVVEAYDVAVADGFEPDWACRDDAEFQATFENRFGQALALAELPDGVTALGLAYGHTLSKWTLHLLVQAGDDPVIVFVDRADRAAMPSVPIDDELHLHERTIGRLVAYELSPREAPAILDHLSDPKEVSP